jgi:hypothetical protein
MVSVVVRGRIPGRAEIGDVRLEVASTVTARDLIRAAVAAQLSGGTAAWAGYSPLYLTDQEITAMAAQGVVRLPSHSEVGENVAAAAAHALEAFGRGLFVIFAGARRIEDPGEAVALQDGDRVVFLRLTALVGG